MESYKLDKISLLRGWHKILCCLESTRRAPETGRIGGSTSSGGLTSRIAMLAKADMITVGGRERKRPLWILMHKFPRLTTAIHKANDLKKMFMSRNMRKSGLKRGN